MTYHYKSLTVAQCEIWRGGGVDANGQVPERTVSDGGGNPCRCCLNDIPAGADMLILAVRPFERLSPYAETGPIFLCADCSVYPGITQMPPVLLSRPRHLLKGYGLDDRIVYGTGEITQTTGIPAYLDRIFARKDVGYVHVRSASNNCFTLRIERG